MSPKVTILMPVYNSERYLSVSVQSILNQTWSDFEFIIVDDCSTDNTAHILNAFANQDRRIHLLRNSTNLGVTRSLNIGFDQAQGEYIARMDADDVAAPTRIEKQLIFLEQDRDVGIVGGGCNIVDSEGGYISDWMKPAGDLAIRWEMLLDNPFIHPTVMLRRKVLDDHRLRFNEALLVSQDYDFWTRILQFTKGANLSEPVLSYRVHRDQISRGNRDRQKEMHTLISQKVIRETLTLDVSLRQVDDLCSLFTFHENNLTEEDIHKAARLYLDMWSKFQRLYSSERGIKEMGRQVVLRVLEEVYDKVDHKTHLFSHPEMKKVSHLPYLISWMMRKTSLYENIKKIYLRKNRSG